MIQGSPYRGRYPTNKVMGRGLIDYIPLMEIRRNFKKNEKFFLKLFPMESHMINENEAVQL